MMKHEIKPSQAGLRRYCEKMEELRGQGATTEGSLRHAFQVLLAETARTRGWTLVPEYSEKRGDHRIQVDGVIKDRNGFVRCWWEAKDTDDNLDAEIAAKFKKGYPKDNIIFEDTETAVLFQDGTEVGRIKLTDKNEVARLLNAFLSYTPPNIEGWEKASLEFKDEVPRLARRLNEIIKDAHKTNPGFESNFGKFFGLCKGSLNPNIARDAVDKMLIQHLLTERVINRIFKDSDFRNRNIIAVEIEKVIGALVSKSFNREEFLKSLDRFYIAIENAASFITDFNRKTALSQYGLQAFLSGLFGQGG